MPISKNTILKIPNYNNAEQLLTFFSNNKERFNPFLLTVLLNKLSHLISDETLDQHKAAILEILEFSEEFETKLFDTISIATFFNTLAKWPALMAEPVCERVIDNFLPDIAERAYAFKGQSISNLFNALSKYPPLAELNHSDSFKEAINALLLNVSNNPQFNSQDILLTALALCYFTHFKLLDASFPQQTIIKLLKSEILESAIVSNQLSPMAINQLQQIFIYAPEIKSAMGSRTLTHLLNEDVILAEKPESSLLHQDVFRYLKKCVPAEFLSEIFINEYKIGHTFVDIACPKERFCIQVNGPYHLYGERKTTTFKQ